MRSAKKTIAWEAFRLREGILRGLSPLVLCAVAIPLIAGEGAAWARVVIQDGFTNGTANGNLAGNQPDTTHLPGGAYSDSAPLTHVVYNNATPTSIAQLNTNAGAYFPLSTASYTVTTPLSISASINLSAIQGSLVTGNIARGIGIGFSAVNSATSDYSAQFFDGVAVDASGDVALVSNGTVGNVDAWNSSGGAFNPNSLYPLSYTYNTSTGAVSNVEVAELNYSFASSTVAPASAYVEFFGSSASFSSGNLTNFIVSDSAVPEPASISLLVVASSAALLRRRRRSIS